jgi:hypothetical protein
MNCELALTPELFFLSDHWPPTSLINYLSYLSSHIPPYQSKEVPTIAFFQAHHWHQRVLGSRSLDPVQQPMIGYTG